MALSRVLVLCLALMAVAPLEGLVAQHQVGRRSRWPSARADTGAHSRLAASQGQRQQRCRVVLPSQISQEGSGDDAAAEVVRPDIALGGVTAELVARRQEAMALRAEREKLTFQKETLADKLVGSAARRSCFSCFSSSSLPPGVLTPSRLSRTIVPQRGFPGIAAGGGRQGGPAHRPHGGGCGGHGRGL